MMDELPKGWAQCRVGDFFHSFSGGTPSKQNRAYWGGNIPWISSGDIKNAEISAGSQFITRSGLNNSSSKLCRRGSVLVVVRSGILKHTLPVSILTQEAAINQDIKCFDSGCDELNGWFALALRAYSKEILALNREGTTVQSVKYDTLRDFQLPVPSLAERKRILKRLAQLLGEIHQCKQRMARIPVLVDRFRQSVFAAACSGRLTADWRASHQMPNGIESTLQQIRERRMNLSSGRKKQAIEHIYSAVEQGDTDALPEGWAFTFLNKLAESFDYGTSSKSAQQGTVPVLRMGNLQKGKVDWNDLAYTSDGDEIRKYALKPNTVLFNRTNSPELVGKTAMYRGERPAIFAGYLIRINPVAELDPEYLNLCLNAPAAREFCLEVKSDGVSQSNINAQKLGTFEVPFCSIAEQREIVKRAATLLAAADRIESGFGAAKKQIDNLSPSLLAKAFRGELVPTEAELADREGREYESSEAVLRCIRAMKSVTSKPTRVHVVRKTKRKNRK